MKVSAVPGLPDGVPEHLRDQGIEELYPPQAEAVEKGVASGENLVASVPTASGKTLIAALAMLSAVERGGKALYIVPLRALAGEKAAEFGEYEQFGVSVGVSTGNFEDSGEALRSKDIIVATSEKVDSLVRNGAPWIDDLGCVVADEVHLVDDRNRGPTLEVTLAKLRQRVPGLQVVALSATVGNAGVVADWLDAELVDSTWRPIDLKTGVHYGSALHFDDGSQRELPTDGGDQTAAVVGDTLQEDGSTLVFVNSRRNAEASARRLSETVKPFLSLEQEERLGDLADEIRGVSDTETSDDLAAAVEKGAAFHHAGLAREHRTLVEDAFRERLIRVVCATPTLAAGVNTPSRRVVVRDWQRYDGTAGGMQPLSVLEVHQMFGRAGRPGMDPYGEAVLLANSHDQLEELFDRYIYAEPEHVQSKLAAQPALRTHVLATVATGFATTRTGLLEFLDETLYAEQTADSGRLEEVADDVLAYLDANEFIERQDDNLQATPTGHLVSRLYVDPMSAAIVIDGLRDGRQAVRSTAAPADGVAEAAEGTAAEADGFQTASDMLDATESAGGGADPTPFGLYHLVSRTPDMYELYLRSGDRERYSELAVEREGEFLGKMPSEFQDNEFEDWLAATKTARLLEDWASEVDEDRIAERYGVGPGDIRGKVETAEWLLHAAERLAGELDMECAVAIREARKRVEYGVGEELLDLASVRNVGRKRARRLYEAGIETRADLREADKSVVLGALRGRRKTAQTVLENVGHPEPAMESVEKDRAVESSVVAATASDGDEAGEDQASLGDFE